MKKLVMLLAALMLCGCPKDDPEAKPYASIIPITSGMSLAQTAIVAELNRNRTAWDKERRVTLLGKLAELEASQAFNGAPPAPPRD